MIIGKGLEQGVISEEEVEEISSKAFSEINLDDKKVLVIVPDISRTAPIEIFFRVFFNLIGERVNHLDYLIALGTHPPMNEEKIYQRVGISAQERVDKYGMVRFFNHTWNDANTLQVIGTIPGDEIYEITHGLMNDATTVALNKMVFEYDFLVMVGPTFPHEVVGFSGGNKYLFPGISGPEILNMFHWLGALITNPEIIGTKYTPVRKIIDRAASFLPVPRLCFSLVVTKSGLNGLFVGTPEEAYSKAADLSAKLHIVHKLRSFHRVLSMAPLMYEDLWTAGKCMYKLESVVAEGGDLIIYAPHISEVSYTHGEIIDQIGYHVRDYFVNKIDKFWDIPKGVLAHATHVKGIGTYENGVETPRINVILATQIPEERCRRINLGYIDPQAISPKDWEGREEEGILLVRNAGEILYQL
ncbi:MAG: lactate racemase domain-containing protein [bacterium]